MNRSTLHLLRWLKKPLMPLIFGLAALLLPLMALAGNDTQEAQASTPSLSQAAAAAVASATEHTSEPTYQVTLDAQATVAHFVSVPFQMGNITQWADKTFMNGSYVFSISSYQSSQATDSLMKQGFKRMVVDKDSEGNGGVYIYIKQIGFTRVSFSFDETIGNRVIGLLSISGPLDHNLLKPVVPYLNKYSMISFQKAAYEKWVYSLGNVNQAQQDAVVRDLKAALTADHWELQDYQLGNFWVFLRGDQEVRFGLMPGDVGENLDVVFYNNE